MSVVRGEVAGHQAFTIAGRRLAVTCLPARGAHLTSLREDGHEWLWTAPDGPELPPYPADDCFDLHEEGADDCFPTVTEDVVRGVRYPDHGMVWQRPWRVVQAIDRLDLAIDLPIVGLTCERSLAADGDGLLLSWRIVNRTALPVPYVWCWHPLFARRPGDRLELPGATSILRRRRGTWTEAPWPSPEPGMDLAAGEVGERRGLKGFLAATGMAGVTAGGKRLVLRWDPLVLPWIGLWIKCIDRQQWALEPSNVRADRLGQLASIPPEALLPAQGERRWSISLQPG